MIDKLIKRFSIVAILLILQITLEASKIELEKVSLQLQWKHQFQFAGYYIAKEKGYYKDVGLEVDIKEFKFDINPVDIVISNKATYGIGRSSLIKDKSEGKPVKIISAIFQSSPLVLIASPQSNIKSIKDLKGKTNMFTPDKSAMVSIDTMLSSEGISSNDMKALKHTFNINDLLTGKTDVMSTYLSTTPYLFEKAGLKPVIFDPKDYGFDFYNDILFTSDDEVNNHPNRVKRFNKASLKGWKYAFDNIGETVNLIIQKYNIQNKTKDELIYEANKLKELAYYKTNKIGTINRLKIKSTYDIYNLLGFIKNKIDTDELIFIDNNIQLSIKQKEYLKNKKQITVCGNNNFAPIEFIKNDNFIGIVPDSIDLLQTRLDINFKYIKTANWKESIQFFKDNKCDILSGANKNKQREKYANFTTPYISLDLAIITTKDKVFIKNLDIIAKEKILMKQKSGKIALIKELHPNLNIITKYTNEPDMFKALNDGEGYATVATLPVASYMIRKYGLDNLQISGYLKQTYNLSIAVQKENKILFNILNNTLETIPLSKLNNIKDNWTGIKIKQKIDYTMIVQILIIVSIVVLLFIYRQYVLTKTNIKLQKLQKIVENKSLELQNNINTMSKYIIYSRTNLKGIITEASDAFCDISQYSRDELLGQPHNIIRHPDIPKEVFKDMWQVIQNGKIWQGEVKNRKKDGGYYWVDADISPEFDSDGNIYSYVAIRHDITAKKDFEIQQKSLIEAEILAKNKAEESTKAKSEFLANMSHEIRTPMNGIIGMSHLVLQTELNKKQINYIQNIDSSAKLLLGIINDILDFSKIEAGKLEINKINFDLTDIIKKLKNSVLLQIQNKGLQFSIVYNKKDTLYYGDSLRIFQILLNLLTNAIKFTLNGEVELKVTKQDNNIVRFEVKDSGIGITKEQQNKLFQSFSQADSDTTRKYGGTGLGLVISKQLIELMNGKIWVISKIDVGSTFGFELELLKGSNDIEQQCIQEENKVLLVSDTIKDDDLNKESLDENTKIKLLDDLKQFALKRNAKGCHEIISNIYEYKLSAKDKILFNNIRDLIENRKYKNIVEMI